MKEGNQEQIYTGIHFLCIPISFWKFSLMEADCCWCLRQMATYMKEYSRVFWWKVLFHVIDQWGWVHRQLFFCLSLDLCFRRIKTFIFTFSLFLSVLSFSSYSVCAHTHFFKCNKWLNLSVRSCRAQSAWLDPDGADVNITGSERDEPLNSTGFNLCKYSLLVFVFFLI